MSTTPAVGQVWADNDPRIPKRDARYLRIEHVDRDGSTQNGKPHAECVRVDRIRNIAGETIGWTATTRRVTRIRLDRFRPTSTGYRLVEDVEEA